MTPARAIRLCVLSHPCFRSVNRQVYAELLSRGVEILIIAPDRLGDSYPDPHKTSEPPIKFLPLTTSNPRTYLFKNSHSVLSEFRPDAILIEADPVSRLAVNTGRWAHAHGSKCLCLSVDNLDFSFVPHLRRTGIMSLPQIVVKNALHQAAVRYVDAVFTISAEGTSVFQKRGYRKVVQVPLGFDSDIFYIDPNTRSFMRDALAIAQDAIVFGYFGRVTPQKGVHLIVEALARVARDHPAQINWRILMDRFEHDAYSLQIEQQIEKLGLSSRVISFEARHGEIAKYMVAVDAVLLASQSTRSSIEQYGRVIPEAMACGALAIVSDSGTPKELVGDYGIVLPEGNVDRLADTLTDVMLNPSKFTQMRAAGAERALRLYSVTKQADIFMQILQVSVS